MSGLGDRFNGTVKEISHSLKKLKHDIKSSLAPDAILTNNTDKSLTILAQGTDHYFYIDTLGPQGSKSADAVFYDTDGDGTPDIAARIPSIIVGTDTKYSINQGSDNNLSISAEGGKMSGFFNKNAQDVLGHDNDFIFEFPVFESKRTTRPNVPFSDPFLAVLFDRLVRNSMKSVVREVLNERRN